MPDESPKQKEKISLEKTCIKNLGFQSFGNGSNVSAVDVRDGKVIRIRPLHYDWKYNPEEIKGWTMEARGKTFQPKTKTLIPPLALAYKKRTYSSNRILYPLKRVDWDPKGERNPQNRGISKYVRISWDEALDLVVSEIKRVHKQYGPFGILGQIDGHGESKTIHGPHGCSCGLLDLLGGYTMQVRNPDSWEGWWWGAKHVWGSEPVGQQMPHANVVPDIARHSGLLIYQGADPETTTWGWGGQTPSRLMYWFSELGIKQIFISPDLNYAAAIHADKWIPILPNTDAALQLAIIYVWLLENTYDKEYLKTHSVGFEKIKDYVLGKEDGIPKTPKWAAEITGVPSRIIKALAREWASSATSTVHCNGGPYIRGPYSTEPARLEVVLLGMQGLGRPGVQQLKMIEWGFLGLQDSVAMPRSEIIPDTHSAYHGSDTMTRIQKQCLPKTLIHEAILNPPLTWYSSSALQETADDQFRKYKYPEDGCSEIHMIWSDTPCLITCWNESNKIIESYRNPKIEFMLVQHPWFENDTLFADIILPSNTTMEVEDISADALNGEFRTLQHEEQCIEPIGESKSDYEIVCSIAERLGLLEKYTKSKNIKEWVKFGFSNSGVDKYIDFETFMEKGYFVVPADQEWDKYPAGLRMFYLDPEKNPLTTPSGKLEFYSQKLAEFFPGDSERPPYPKWIPFGESHQESLLCERAKKYPLLVVSNHPKWGIHANHHDVTWFREINTCKVKGPDGYLYHPVWLNPSDAAKRGIQHGDVVKIFNERGAVLTGAFVTERIIPGAISIDHGSRYDPIVPGVLDRGGAINTITPIKRVSKNAAGMVSSGFLAEIELVDLDEMRRKYPEAFNRPFHRTAGLNVNSFIEWR